jgi:hypothetical protein
MINLEKDTYTKEEVQAFLQEQETQITDLTGKVAEFEEKVKSIPELTKANNDYAIKIEMLKNGLSEDLFDLVSADNVEVAKSKISKLVELNKKNKVDNSYKPEGHKETDDAYSVAEKQGDVQTMLKSKLSKLFKNE